ncbi:MAG: cytochrome c [Rhodothermales bacterium]|nr:cytochrome c [Rhodothermales bacterium]
MPMILGYMRWVLPAVCGAFLIAAAAERAPLAGPSPDGEEVYLHNCMDCHQDGAGTPGLVPPLDGAPWVDGYPDRIIRVLLNGLTGEVVVEGVTYNGVMPGWRNLLSDEEIAAVLTYIRSAWDNDAGPVTPEEVATIRAATADRTTPWTAAELAD